MDNNKPLLRTEKLTKRFGEVIANQEVSFDIKPGEIHCLLGENGAGKTTLSECLFGYYHPEGGKIYFNEELVKITSPSDAIRLGIGMVHQHFILARPISVIENIVVGTDAAQMFLDLTEANKRLTQLCSDYDVSIDLNAKIWQLSVGEQQWVEILKALFVGVKLLILDEPTAVLTPQEADKLFVILEKMKQEGLSILFITHKLREVMAVSDRVTVLRKGEKIATVNTADMTRADLAKMMVGRDVVFRVSKPEVEIGETVFEVEELCAQNDREQEALCSLSLSVKVGEIVGVAGVSGNGQRELFEAIVGVRKAEAGKILLAGKDITNQSPYSIADHGMAHIPEDRLVEGLVPEFTVAENLILGLHMSRFFNYGGGWLDTKEVDEFAENCIRDFEIATPSASHPSHNLSGGNIQKVIIARELSGNPNFLIANQPTRGLDVGAIEYVHNRLLQQREGGTGILIFSEDLDEIMALADRILVIFKGSIIGELDPSVASLEEIGLLMAGSMDGEK
jgi:general nucleoside transport system ATP-binding protein